MMEGDAEWAITLGLLTATTIGGLLLNSNRWLVAFMAFGAGIAFAKLFG